MRLGTISNRMSNFMTLLKLRFKKSFIASRNGKDIYHVDIFMENTLSRSSISNILVAYIESVDDEN